MSESESSKTPLLLFPQHDGESSVIDRHSKIQQFVEGFEKRKEIEAVVRQRQAEADAQHSQKKRSSSRSSQFFRASNTRVEMVPEDKATLVKDSTTKSGDTRVPMPRAVSAKPLQKIHTEAEVKFTSRDIITKVDIHEVSPKLGSLRLREEVLSSPKRKSSSTKLRLMSIQQETQQRVREHQRVQEESQRRRREVDELAELQRVEEEKQAALKLARSRTAGLKTGTGRADSALVRGLAKAMKHYNSHLIVRKGFSPWRRYIQLCRLNVHNACIFRNANLYRWAWNSIHCYVEIRRHESATRMKKLHLLAASHHKAYVVRNIFRQWKLLRRTIRAKADAIRRHFGKFLRIQKSIKAWRISLEVQRRLVQKNMSIASRYSSKKCKHRYWVLWLAFIEDERLDREAKSRTAYTWHKAASLLYDNNNKYV